MIIVKLQGGLGNQLFQYALGRHLALKNGSRLVLDVSFLRQQRNVGHTVRKFELNVLPIRATIRNYFWNRWNLFDLWRRICGIRYIRENSFAFQPDILHQRGPLYLDGFWQSESYFSGIRGTILADLNWRLPAAFEEPADMIRSCNAVSVHIRRGDYVSPLLPPTYYDLYQEHYYEAAIQQISGSVTDPVFFFFSDDITWVKGHLELPLKHHFIGQEPGAGPYGDLHLMSLCKHNIIANSSFSWWGAWLNANPGKIVVAPKKWFIDPSLDSPDLIPAAWVRV